MIKPVKNVKIQRLNYYNYNEHIVRILLYNGFQIYYNLKTKMHSK